MQGPYFVGVASQPEDQVRLPARARPRGSDTPFAQSVVPLTRADTDLARRARPTFDGTVINAYDAGAKGDGVTDDTAALNDALENGGTLFLPQVGVRF